MGLQGVKARVSTFKHTGTATSSNQQQQSRFSRLPHNELLDLLISQFSQAPYWSLKSLNEHVKQPQSYLKQTLSEIANLVRNGPYSGMWALKQEFKQGGTGGGNSLEGQRQEVETSSGRVKKEEGEDRGGAAGGSNGEFRVKEEEGAQDDLDEEDDDDEGMEFVS